MNRLSILFCLLSLNALSQISLPIQQSFLPKNSLVVDYDFSKSAGFTRGATTLTNIAGTASGNATVVNTPIFLNSLGIISFNGTNQYVVTPNLRTYFKSLDASVQKSFTMSFWVYPTALSGDLVYELDSQTPNFGWNASNIELVNGYVKYRVWNGSAAGPQVTSSTTVNLNQWYHVAMVYDGTSLKGYLNGVLQGTQAYARVIPTNGQFYALGAGGDQNMGTAAYGNFNLAQFKIHNLPLTDNEILSEYELRKSEFDYTIHSPSTNSAPTYWAVSSNWAGETTFSQDHYTPWLNNTRLGWAALYNDTNQWITLNYDEPAYIKGIVTQGRANNGNQWVSAANVETSITGGAPWTRVLSNKSLNVNSTEDVLSLFTTPVFAKAVRVLPTTWNNHITMRMGMLVKPNNYTSDKLVLHYNPSMTECYPGSGTSLIDLSGNGMNGTISNLTYSNPAFTYNGSNSQVSIPDNAIIEPGTGNWTMEAWFKPTQFTVITQTVLGKFQNGGTSSIISYAMRQLNGNIRADFSNGTTAFTSDDYAISLNTWVQMIYVWDRTNSMLYVYSNGVLKQSRAITISGGIRNGTTNLFIGSYNGGEYSQYYTGQIGIVRLYSKALTAAEVLKNFNANKIVYGL